MLSVKSISAKEVASKAQYFEEYYSRGEPPGVWLGRGAEEIGLNGSRVKKGELLEAFIGCHPRTKDPLAQNAGPNHKPGWDLTFSAPKSVSAVWATADAKTQVAIGEAQRRAVAAALAHAEATGAFFTREGHDGIVRIPHGSLIAAIYEHSGSRDGQAQLHSHALVMNLTSDGRCLDLDAYRRTELGAVYRAALAADLRKLGFEIERDAAYFRVVGVPKELEQQLSSRAREIDAHLRSLGIDPASKAGQIYKLDTRKGKPEITRREIFADARKEAAKHRFDPQLIRKPGPAAGKSWTDREFLAEAFAQASTLTRTQLRAAGYIHAQDRDARVEQRIDALLKSGELIELIDPALRDVRFTSREMLAIERDVAGRAKRMSAQVVTVDRKKLDEASRELSSEQASALEHIMSRRLSAVSGVAGSGKSRLVGAARELWQGQGRRVIAAAIAAKAARGLADGAGIAEATTVDSLLARLDRGTETFTPGTVIVLDEAGMVGSRKMQQIVSAAEKSGAHIHLIGDYRQLQPIDAGGSFRAICRSVGSAELRDVRRQNREIDRKIVRDLAEGRTEQAVAAMRAQGSIREHESTHAAKAEIARATVEDLAAGKSAIAMTGTRRDAADINQLAREHARAKGLVTGPDLTFTTASGDEKSLADGDRIMFTRNDKRREIQNGLTGRVTAIDHQTNRITVRTDAGRDISLSLNEYKHIDHAYAFTTHKAQGITADTARALLDERMLDRSLGYVQASRHKDSFEWHGTQQQIAELETTLSRSRLKDVSTQYPLRPAADQSWNDLDKETKVGLGFELEQSRLDRAIIDLRKSVQNDKSARERAGSTRPRGRDRNYPRSVDKGKQPARKTPTREEQLQARAAAMERIKAEIQEKKRERRAKLQEKARSVTGRTRDASPQRGQIGAGPTRAPSPQQERQRGAQPPREQRDEQQRRRRETDRGFER